uniref:EF-hand domain-containing protein n=1 Tax=Globisporangium ultimum (strain ATCC 200006 / CBS 805.95 / DAOM BR144) TaxID=431595 RepID=K3X0M0_GLOUD
MGLKNSRPVPQAHAELHVAPFLQRRIRSWHLDHVTQLALLRYRSLTKRFCIDALQLSMVLGVKDEKFIQDMMKLFLPKTPTRVQCMVDAMEILIAFILLCQAPSMLSRFEAIFDVMDVNSTGFITTTDLVVFHCVKLCTGED